uniref:Inositol oxygenase n=1 Tax=Cynoglossus semilaevis TaxID=244447 RepID=A0A3P8V1C5_CYNSE
SHTRQLERPLDQQILVHKPTVPFTLLSACDLVLSHSFFCLCAFLQWSVVGDTFPVGCKFQNSIVFRDSTFLDNPDNKNQSYNTEHGIYEANCGLDKVLMSWGHDEYLYRVLKFNNCSIPEEGMYMIRFHSFYPWHSHEDYMHLCSDKDLQMLPWVKEFNKFDLYTKTTVLPDVEKLMPYYQSIVDKYCPGILKW